MFYEYPFKESANCKDALGLSLLMSMHWLVIILIFLSNSFAVKRTGRRQNFLSLTTNFSQNVTEPPKGISYTVSDLCQRFTKLTGPFAYTLHSNPIHPTYGLL